jgi:hypothetical protein
LGSNGRRQSRDHRPIAACIIAACASVPGWKQSILLVGIGRPSIDAGASPPDAPTIDHRANVLGSGVRDRGLNRDHSRVRLAADHRERLWDRARKIVPHHLRFFFQKPKAILWHLEGEGGFLAATPCLLLGTTRK